MLDRDRIVEAVDLAALADELLGPRRGTVRSPTWPCPNVQHPQTGRTPPVTIFRARSGEERWHCHGCGIGGTAIDLVMAVEGRPVREVMEDLARRVGLGEAADLEPRVRRHRGPPSPPSADQEARPVADAEGLAAFVDECAARLWTAAGAPVRRWLTGTRGIPEHVLRTNRVGADSGGRHQSRPDGMPGSGPAAVLPVFVAGRPVFAQLRVINPFEGRPRYLNASGRLAANPRVALYEPPEPIGRCVIIAEGILDALSANTAGFRAAAVLGAGLASRESDGTSNSVADQLNAFAAPLVIAFDADDAGERGARQLTGLLRERGARVARAHVPRAAGDLNAWMRRSPDWEKALRSAVRTAVIGARKSHQLSR